MKNIMALSNPDILLAGTTDGGVNGTPDELAFAAQRVGLYTKYFNAPLRMAQYWDDPAMLSMGGLPKFKGGAGSTVFWTTGSALFKHGENKEKAAEYIQALTYNPQIWQDSIAGTATAHPGQLPPYASIYAGWNANRPDWLPPFVDLVRGQLDRARAIQNHLFGLQQFVIGKPIWETYLTGEESDPGGARQGRRGRPGRDQARRRLGTASPFRRPATRGGGPSPSAAAAPSFACSCRPAPPSGAGATRRIVSTP